MYKKYPFLRFLRLRFSVDVLHSFDLDMAGFFPNKIFQIVIAVLIPFLGMLINWASGSQSNMYPWYDEIARPTWGPPDWVNSKFQLNLIDSNKYIQ